MSYLLTADFSYGPYIDIKAASYAKLFFANLFNHNNYLGNNVDTRNSFGLTGAKHNLNNLFDDSRNFLVNFINLRFEFPLLNLRLRGATQKKPSLYILGFISNLNTNFIHLGPTYSKSVFHKILTLSPVTSFIKSRLSGTLQNFTAENTLSNSISQLSFKEVGFLPKRTNDKFTIFSFFFGQSENFRVDRKTNFTLYFTHQAEEAHFFDLFMNATNLIVFPIKFYFEKVCYYTGLTFNFFNTSHHYSFCLPNTKEEWTVISALYEYCFNNFFSDSYFKALQLPQQLSTLTFLTKPLYSMNNYLKKGKIPCSVTNFYSQTALTRLSPTLNLCSINYTIHNDYIFTKKNDH